MIENVWMMFGLIATLAVFSGFFSAAETALFSLSRLRLDFLSDKGDKRAQLLSRILEQPDRLLGAILIGNNICNIFASILAGALGYSLIEDQATATFVSGAIMTATLLIFSEILPKVFASQFSEKYSFLISRPIWLLIVVLAPVVWLVTKFTDAVFGAFGVKVEGKRPRITRDELMHYVQMSGESGHLRAGEDEMLEKVFEFSERTVADVMVPRDDIVAVASDVDQDSIMGALAERGYTRVPVFEGDLDHVVGVVHTKDLVTMLLTRGMVVMQDLIREPFFVQADRKVSQVLKRFQSRRLHIAVVQDSNNKTVGIVTMEDILEEIVGEIEDEHDEQFQRVDQPS